MFAKLLSVRLSLLGFVVLMGVVLSLSAMAAPQLRIGTLAPKNSTYHRQLIEVGEAWKSVSGDGAKYQIYPDGSQGGETDMARRLRIGQLQGALLSVVGLREIEPSVAALQALPLAFRSWEEVDYVREKLRPTMEKKFLDKGFVVLAWGDGGWVRFFSKEAGVRPDDYKKMKFFAWAAESEQQEIMKNLGYTPVPLETADILPAIQTGMITAVPSTPYFALASQIYTTANHMLDINWAPIVGALVVTKKAWDELTPSAQETLRLASQKAGLAMRTKARQEVDEAVDAMKKRGLNIHTPSPEQGKEWQALADKLYPKIRGTMVPAATFDEVFMHLNDFRAGKK
jgi:TRAP-type transport system periplasmic protein